MRKERRKFACVWNNNYSLVCSSGVQSTNSLTGVRTLVTNDGGSGSFTYTQVSIIYVDVDIIGPGHTSQQKFYFVPRMQLKSEILGFSTKAK